MSRDTLRDTRNRDAMRACGLDAVICRLPENVLLLTGYWTLSSFAFVLYPREGPVSLIAVDTEATAIPDGAVDEVRTFRWGVIGATDPYEAVGRHLRDAIRAAGLSRGRIGYEAGFEAIAAGHMAAEMMVPAAVTSAMIAGAATEAALVDATPALYLARARKTPSEVAKLRRANAVAAMGLHTFRSLYEPGRREAEVAAAVEATIIGRGIGHDGAAHVRAWAQLMTGPASAHAYTPHPTTSARIIERGDLGVLELATVVDGYWSDLTRTRIAGAAADARQRELYDAIVAAHGAVLRDAKPGMTGAAVDALARAEIDRRGLGAYFVHHTGHGLGFRYHEPRPSLHPLSEGITAEGMVSSVEPGLYIEGVGGLRLEDNIVFTATGIDLLSTFDDALSDVEGMAATTSTPAPSTRNATASDEAWRAP